MKLSDYLAEKIYDTVGGLFYWDELWEEVIQDNLDVDAFAEALDDLTEEGYIYMPDDEESLIGFYMWMWRRKIGEE